MVGVNETSAALCAGAVSVTAPGAETSVVKLFVVLQLLDAPSFLPNTAQ
jgi:hypothetical protein